MKFRIDVTVEVSLPCDGKLASMTANALKDAVTDDVLRRFYGRETTTRVMVAAGKVEAAAGPEQALAVLAGRCPAN